MTQYTGNKKYIDILGVPCQIIGEDIGNDKEVTLWDNEKMIIWYNKSMSKTCIERFISQTAMAMAADFCGVKFPLKLRYAVGTMMYEAGFKWPSRPLHPAVHALPSSVTILNQVYFVEQSQGSAEAVRMGEMSEGNSRIWISSLASPAQREATLVHEWVHAFLDMFRVDYKEEQVLFIATMLYMEGFRIK